MSTSIKIRRDTALRWATNNPTPALGEMCLVTDTTPQRLKIGDGITRFNALPYFTLPNATSADAGLLSNVDKQKLDGIAMNAINAATAFAMLYRPVGESVRAKFSTGGGLVRICGDPSAFRLMVIDGVAVEPAEEVELEAGEHVVEYVMANAAIIPAAAFVDCADMIELHIPSWVHSIGDGAFMGCPALVAVECEAVTPPLLEANAFDPALTGSCVCLVHKVALDDYRGGDWASYFQTIETF